MSTRSGSGSDHDPANTTSTTRAGDAQTAAGEDSDRVLAAADAFRLPSSGDLAAVMDPQRLLWWAGLGAAAAIGIIEWPVAVAVGVGSYVAERFARQALRNESPSVPNRRAPLRPGWRAPAPRRATEEGEETALKDVPLWCCWRHRGRATTMRSCGGALPYRCLIGGGTP